MKCQLVFNNIFNQMFFIGIKHNTLESKWKGWEYIEGHLLVMWGSLFFIDIFKHNLILVTLLKCLPFMIYENGARTKCILFLYYNIEWSNKIILIAGLILYINHSVGAKLTKVTLCEDINTNLDTFTPTSLLEV